MFCTTCGKEMRSGDRFCPSCGGVAPDVPQSGPRVSSRLVRVHQGKKIAGICAGIARHNEWDVTLVRVAFLAAILLHGVGLLAYLIAWIAMPSEECEMHPASR
jgi:phage shock protein PspC (stress-responsive transcriptional regulator)